MNEIVIRPARAADKAAVNALSAHIWEGEDYVPYAFPDWVADSAGEFSVAYEGDKLVGFAKLSQLGPGEWWMEGLRVHPEQRGRGIARRLHHHLLDQADELGPGILRFATNGKNTAVHHLAESTGFSHICSYTGATIPASESGAGLEQLRPATVAEEAAVRTWLDQSAYFRAAHGLYEEHWTWLELAPRLSRLLAAGHVHWWQPDAQPEGVIIIDPTTEGEEEERPLRLSYLDAPAAALPLLTHALVALATSGSWPTVTSRPLALEEICDAYGEAGWEVKDYQLWIFERPLAG